jgi:hypothetical protein
MNGRNLWPGGWRGATLIVIGILMGAMVIEPAVGHVTQRLAHLREHLDPRYVNVGEALDASDGFGDSCDPNTTTYDDCSGAAATITLGKPGTVLVMITSHYYSNQTNSAGSCRLERNDGDPSGDINPTRPFGSRGRRPEPGGYSIAVGRDVHLRGLL